MVKQNVSRRTSLSDSTSAFRIAFAADLIICQIGYISVPAIAAAVFMVLWGARLFLKNYVINLNIKNVNYYGWLLAFIASNVITVAIQGYDRGFWLSIGMVLFMPIIFFMFYGLHSEAQTQEGKERVYKELFILCNVIMWMSVVINILSLISLYAVGQSINYLLGYLVVYENRFTGIYYNPNLMAFSSFCAMFCCHILWQGDFYNRVTGKQITKKRRAVVVAAAGLNMLVIFLTDSNATMLITVCYLITYLFYKLFGGKELHISHILKRAAVLIISFALLGGGIFAVRTVIQNGASQTLSEPGESSAVFETSGNDLDKITFEHENKNIDSGRIKLFKQGINVIRHHPIFGVGRGEIVKYGNRYNDNKMKYSDFHNGYLTVFVCSGAIGFLLFIIFAVCLGRRMMAALFSVKPAIKGDVFPCIAAFIAAYCVYALFEKTLVFDATFMVVFFWLVLGYGAVCMADCENDGYRVCAFYNKNRKAAEDTAPSGDNQY